EFQNRCGGIAQAFFATLSPDERELFKATTLAEQLLEEVKVAEQLHKDKSVSRRVSQALKPFLVGISQYSAALDVISNASDGILSPIWGSARIVLHLAAEFGEYFEKISSMLQQVGLHLNSLRRFPRLYPHNNRLENAMVDVYRVVFQFLTDARSVFKQANDKRICQKGMIGLRSMAKLVWKPFKAQFGDYQAELSSCMDKVSTEVDIAEREEACHERERAEKERQAQASRWNKTVVTHQKLETFFDEQSMRKIDQWLNPVNHDSNHEAAVKLRHKSTGSWFLEGDAFKKWLNETNTFLCLRAIPGAGKTILISSVVEFLKEHVRSPDIGLAYFYCDYKDQEKQRPSKLLCTLLSQLARQHRSVFQRLQSFVQERCKENPASTPTHDELRGNFGTFLEGTFQQVVLVVDAIDESPQHACMVGDLKTFSKTFPSIKILVSSREELDITRAFKSFPHVKIQQSDVASDIESFVEAEIAARIQDKDLTIRRPELRLTICKTLVERSEGMFQWVKCQIQVLCSLGTDKAIIKALDQMPKDLAGTYARILQRLEHDSENINRYQKLLRWLVRSTRSLTLDELAECIGIDLEEENEAMDFDAVETNPENLLKRCSSLVTVSDDGHVSLAHYTVKEFLVSESIRNDLPFFYVGNDDVEAELAQVCLTYLCYSDFIAGSVTDDLVDSEYLDKYKFLNYAATSWGVHAHLSNGKEDELLDLTTRFLKAPLEGRGNYDFWLQVYSHVKAVHHSDWHLFKPLYFAASFGLPKTLRNLLVEEQTDDDSSWAEMQGDPVREAVSQGHAEVVNILLEHYAFSDEAKLSQYLYIASLNGHDDVVRSLLDKGADIDAVGGKQGTALQVATLEGNKAAVQLLIARKANIRVISPRFGTPLSAAAEKGHERCFQMLLNAGAGINAKGGWYAYPLISAIVGQNDSIIQILLNKGANVNLTGGRHVCALMAAAALGKLALVEKLIDIGARVNDENDKGADALHSACCAGHLDVVQLLLDSGADVNAKGGKHRNALNAACSEGFSDIVDVLLDAGAEPNAIDANYGNALQAAGRGGHEGIVRKLSALGCDVHSAGGTRGTALVEAASKGQRRIVELLFELGHYRDEPQDCADALLAAVKRNHEDVLEFLVAKGVKLNQAGRSLAIEWLPLQYAANTGKFEMVLTLLRLGADVNAIGGWTGSVLMAACESNHVDCKILETLIIAGADINPLIPTSERTEFPPGWWPESTPLCSAAANCQPDAVRLLLNHGADPNLQCENLGTALHKASCLGALEIVEMLVSHGADVNLDAEPYSENDNGIITSLQGAAAMADEATVRWLVAQGANIAVERNDSKFKSAVHAAAFYGKIDHVKALLELGGDVNLRGGKLGTCLQAAAVGGHPDVVGVLLDAGAEINEHHVGSWGSALMAAICNCEHDVVKLLLERGVDPNLKAGSEYQYPIIAASRLWDNKEEVQLLIDAGADVNVQGGMFHTALQAAAVDGIDGTLRVLLDAGADTSATGGKYGSALSAAYLHGYYLCTALLSERGASNKVRGGKYGTPLGSALWGSCQILITFLIKEHSADPSELLNDFWGTPLHFCIFHDRYDADYLINLFIDYGADPNGIGGHYGTPLNVAVRRRKLDLMQLLLEKGADPHISGSKKGWTALDLACFWGDLSAFDMLIDKAPDVNASGRYGTLLQTAAFAGHKVVVRELLHRGAKINVQGRGPYGNCLQTAAVQGKEDIVRYLIKQGADIRARGGTFGTVLQAASIRCSKDLVDFLIHKGARVDEQGGRYKTALQAACASGNRAVVLTLLEHKANVNITGGRYGSALQAACVQEHLDVVRMLVEHGANIDFRGGYYGSAIDATAVHGRVKVLRYLIRDVGAVRTEVDRRHNHKNAKWFEWADKNLTEGLEGEEEAKEGEVRENGEDEQEEDEEEGVTMNVESIPDYPFERTDSATSDSTLTPTSSSPEFELAPVGRKGRWTKRKGRRDLASKGGREDISGLAVEVEDVVEDMSPLSWLQVECGYGGDLNGPGR
ncbi:MAG: hypothetical protein Q9174_003911, partial [Haloplaca sp. 1 TL-2023]